MNQLIPSRRLNGRAFARQRNAQGDFLLLAYAAMFASLFLSNDYGLPPRVFLLAVLPAAFFLCGSLSGRIAWPAARLSLSFNGRYFFSLIVVAAFSYLLSLTLSSWSQPDLNRGMVDQQWIYAGQILLFIAITAHAIAFVDRFLVRLIAVLVPLIALSALINVWSFLTAVAPGTPLASIRLLNWLGMPGYTNSTNISLTYAVYFVAAFATIFSTQADRRLRIWLTPFAAILLAAMLLTQSRSAYIGTAIGVIAVILVSRDRTFWKTSGLKYAAAILVLGVALASIPQFRDVVTARGESRRPEIWGIYLGKAIAKPLLGYGGLSNIDITIRDGAIIDQAHNIVLSAQIRGGIFCMLAMVAMLFASAWWALRFWALQRCAIPLAMIATIIPTAMFDYNLLITPVTWPWVTFWFPFAVCAGAEIAVRAQQNQLTCLREADLSHVAASAAMAENGAP